MQMVNYYGLSRHLLGCHAMLCCGRIPTFHRITRRHRPEEMDFNFSLCENLKLALL